MKNQQHQETTKRNYHGIWKKFNQFIIRLDDKPKTWEERVALYASQLYKEGVQSSTLKSYISAIKKVLKIDGYTWDENKIEFTIITKSCRLVNDRVKSRFPIQNGLLELILFRIHVRFSEQIYLDLMYRCMFLIGYFGLFRVGELTSGTHPIRAKDIYNASEKQKLKIYLYSSKTHNKASRPQEIKIEGNVYLDERNAMNRYFDPFLETKKFLEIRGGYVNIEEPLFIFRDRSPVSPKNMREVLKEAIKSLNLNPKYYDTHSLRIGRATDLMKFGYSIEEIKRLGRWRSNAVYKYLK